MRKGVKGTVNYFDYTDINYFDYQKKSYKIEIFIMCNTDNKKII